MTGRDGGLSNNEVGRRKTCYFRDWCLRHAATELTNLSQTHCPKSNHDTISLCYLPAVQNPKSRIHDPISWVLERSILTRGNYELSLDCILLRNLHPNPYLPSKPTYAME